MASVLETPDGRTGLGDSARTGETDVGALLPWTTVQLASCAGVSVNTVTPEGSVHRYSAAGTGSGARRTSQPLSKNREAAR